MNTKEVKAKIFDLETNQFVSDIVLTINLTDATSNSLAIIEIVGRIKTQDFQFAYKPFILEINPSIRVVANLIQGETARWFTEYKIDLQDYSWINTEWFDSLQS
ncbi:MAG: hypothetical protein P9L97_09320 [Candidatus Tenebribacter davisii]|nr:hypothetical protein [Candidatus Tenebribacter davisii]